MKRIDRIIEAHGPDLIAMDGFDSCILGVVEGFNREPVICYDREKVIKQLMKSPMTREEAVEYHQFNQAGAYAGVTTPVFLDRFD